MKIRIDVDESLTQDEVIIRCGHIDKTIQKICQVINDISAAANKLAFYKNNIEYHIPVSDILFFETGDSGVYAHTANSAYEAKQRLYELEDTLPNNFVRISKSAILNIHHVFSIDRNLTASSLVQFHNSHKQVYVSRMYFKTLRIRMTERRFSDET